MDEREGGVAALSVQCFESSKEGVWGVGCRVWGVGVRGSDRRESAPYALYPAPQILRLTPYTINPRTGERWTKGREGLQHSDVVAIRLARFTVSPNTCISHNVSIKQFQKVRPPTKSSTYHFH